MRHWIPTTEEVKANFAFVGDDEVVNNINEQKFDDWLAQHDAEVAKATEQRIIKLLEEHTMRMTNPMDNTVVEGLRITPSELIALIKGENK